MLCLQTTVQIFLSLTFKFQPDLIFFMQLNLSQQFFTQFLGQLLFNSQLGLHYTGEPDLVLSLDFELGNQLHFRTFARFRNGTGMGIGTGTGLS